MLFGRDQSSDVNQASEVAQVSEGNRTSGELVMLYPFEVNEKQTHYRALLSISGSRQSIPIKDLHSNKIAKIRQGFLPEPMVRRTPRLRVAIRSSLSWS